MDDLFVMDLERRYGHLGYAFWFKTLELIGSQGEGGVLTISWANYLQKIRTRRAVALQLLGSCSASGKMVFEDNEVTVKIQCKKFAEFADNYTKYGGVSLKRLQRQKSLSSKQEVEEEVEVEVEQKKKKKKSTLTLPPSKQYGDSVMLTDDEYNKLLVRLTTDARVQEAIELLDNHKGARGAKYKSDYRAILKWVIDALEEREMRRGRTRQDNQSSSRKSGVGGETTADDLRRAYPKAIALVEAQRARDGKNR